MTRDTKITGGRWKGGAVMIVAALAMMVLALAALLMVILTSTDADQEKVEEPVSPQRDGLPRYSPVGVGAP